MTCQISIGPDDALELRTPSGRAISIPVSPHSTSMLWQILWNATQERRQLGKHCYPSEFPAQHVVDAWVKDVLPQRNAEREAELQEEREAKAAERLAAKEKKFGIKLGELDFDI